MSVALSRPDSEGFAPGTCLLNSDESRVSAGLASQDWNLSDADTSEFTHGIHSYPAKFIPQIPSQLIAALSVPGDMVVDPFSGGGTTGVEALRQDRQFFGIDANPIGVLLGSVKTTRLPAASKLELASLRKTVQDALDLHRSAASEFVPSIPNVSKWYSPAVVATLSRIRQMIEDLVNEPARNLARMALANTAARVSYQESESRYVSKPRKIDPAEPRTLFCSELERYVETVKVLDSRTETPDVQFRLGDARRRDDFSIESGSAGLVVTSPPYPNAYDYHLYHRFRLFWLGAEPKELRAVEIGSHLRHQAEADPAASYESDMRRVLSNLYDVLRPGRYCAMVLGTGIYRGEVYETTRRMQEIASDLGWSVLPPIPRDLPKQRRAITQAGRRLQSEDILLLRRPPGSSQAARLSGVLPNYRRFPYEDELAERELLGIVGSAVHPMAMLNGSLAGVAGKEGKAHGLAFWHGVRTESPNPVHVDTLQRWLERPAGGRRKNSTYVTHGIHRYKGKFYPQLAKALLNLSDVRESDAAVLDPFGGSGTVLLEAVINGKDAVSIDCNPLANSIAQAKIDILAVEPRILAKAAKQLLKTAASTASPIAVKWDQFASSTHRELKSWFPHRVLAKLSLILSSVRDLGDPRLIEFFQVLLSDIVREISQQEPRDLRIRRRSDPITDAPVAEFFEQRVEAAIRKINNYQQIPVDIRPHLATGHAILGSSADDLTFEATGASDKKFCCVVSSPPYASALPYVDTDRLSLAAIYGLDRARRKEIEDRLIGSREISKPDVRSLRDEIESADGSGLPESTRDFVLDLLNAVDRDRSAGFRRRQMPMVLYRYFVGISEVMQQVSKRMVPGAHLWFVLGDSRTSIGGVERVIPTVREFAAIAESAQLEWVEEIPITVTREDVAHSKNSITANTVLHFCAPRP